MRILILTNFDVGLYQFRRELIQELLTKNEVYISLPYGELVAPLVEMVLCLLLFIFCIDFGNGKYAKQQNQQPSIQNGATAGKGNIQTRLTDEQNAEQKIHFANLL